MKIDRTKTPFWGNDFGESSADNFGVLLQRLEESPGVGANTILMSKTELERALKFIKRNPNKYANLQVKVSKEKIISRLDKIANDIIRETQTKD